MYNTVRSQFSKYGGVQYTYEHIIASLASHTLHREEGSGHTATIDLSPPKKLAVTNEIRAL